MVEEAHSVVTAKAFIKMQQCNFDTLKHYHTELHSKSKGAKERLWHWIAAQKLPQALFGRPRATWLENAAAVSHTNLQVVSRYN